MRSEGLKVLLTHYGDHQNLKVLLTHYGDH